jgi:hypothetical protein
MTRLFIEAKLNRKKIILSRSALEHKPHDHQQGAYHN